jgi:hypothetical protein
MGVPSPDPRQGFVQAACDEMNAKLGTLYEVPIDPNAIPEHQRLMLKVIAVKIASGRMLATWSAPDEGSSVHAYARRLLDEGLSELHLIANGDYLLNAPPADTNDDGLPDTMGPSVAGSRMPTIHVADECSPVEVFNAQVFGGSPSRFPGFDGG